MPKAVVRAAVNALIFVGSIVAIWWSVKAWFEIESYLLPSPSQVIAATFDPSQRILFHTSITLVESLIGFSLGNLLAFLAGIASYQSKLVRAFVIPLGVALKTTPIIAIVPILLIWMGPGIHTKVIASAMICFFPMLIGVYESMVQTPRALVEYYTSLGASRTEEVLHLRLTYAVPEVFTALRVSSTLAVVGAIVGEMVSATSGLGYLIVVTTYSLQTAHTFAAVIMAACCGFVLYGSVAILQSVVGASRWRS